MSTVETYHRFRKAALLAARLEWFGCTDARDASSALWARVQADQPRLVSARTVAAITAILDVQHDRHVIRPEGNPAVRDTYVLAAKAARVAEALFETDAHETEDLTAAQWLAATQIALGANTPNGPDEVARTATSGILASLVATAA